MFLVDDDLCWSASDLTAAAQCEYGVLRTLDHTLGRAPRVEATKDPLQEHIARLGDRHEEELLGELEATASVRRVDRVTGPHTRVALEAVRDLTHKAFLDNPDLVYQAAFFDGEFFGYADFVERAADGWLVCDAKLARQAKPTALLQLGAYAAQVKQLGLPVSATVSLLLGNGDRADFPVAEVLPVFEERRARLRDLLAEHRSTGAPVAWGDDGVVACGRCVECTAAAVGAEDVILVAGLRMAQRRKLHDVNVRTVSDLASAVTLPDGMAPRTFEKLRAQAVLQQRQLERDRRDEAAPLEHELTASAATTLALLPAPSAGDLFFDFEGDPLHDEGAPAYFGLEYLWGVLDADGTYTPTWAHSSLEERDAFVAFVDAVTERRATYPDMHVYHYAPYETTALKRLAMRYQLRETELDDLLRAEVFVDLYAAVRGSVRVSTSSYSIKALEPLYMGADLRAGDDGAVGDGGASVVAYHEYRATRLGEPAAAAGRLAALADYNAYDCLSTLRLRDWLLERAEEAGVRDQVMPRTKAIEAPELDEIEEPDELFADLLARSGPVQRADRTPAEQAYAMLANALDYYRRERKQFWWGHYDRLAHPIEEWAGSRDVFVVESATILQHWAVPEGRATNARRVLRLVGDWGPGSKPAVKARVTYAPPLPAGVTGPDGAFYGAGGCEKLELDDDDPRVVLLTESRKPDETFDQLPVALTPAPPPGTKELEAEIKAVGRHAATAESLPDVAALDLLARRPPRLHGGAALPTAGSTIENVVAALLSMDDSYVAVQGPPGTGKTYAGSRIIKELVEKYRWRVGVAGPSNAAAENLLSGVVKAGLDPALVGKNSCDAHAPTWTVLQQGVAARTAFLSSHRDTGCVLGGTAWTFANANLVGPGGLDLLVVDEAGQFSLAPTIGAATSAKRLLLLGDPQQLPQVSQGVHAEPVDRSALGWLMDGRDTIPAEHGYFLGESYRMHPRLCAKVSALSYEGRLSAAGPASARELVGVEPGVGVVEVDHAGCRTESPEEADAVVAQVDELLGRDWSDPDDSSAPRPLAQEDFLVVAPFNAQVALVRRSLDAAGLDGVRVGTVDKFQGQEAPVVLVSMTASSHGDVPRGMGFLLSRNRVNVAVSRAQWRTVLIRSRALTSYLPGSPEGLLELGAFIRLCAD